jgi:adenosine deaminase
MLAPKSISRSFALFLLATAGMLGAAPKPAKNGQQMESALAEAKKNPLDLYSFLERMPKGADLHNHFTGAVYAESYLNAAAEDGLCVNPSNFGIIGPPADADSATPCGKSAIPAKTALVDPILRSEIVDSLSMRDFVSGRDVSTSAGHDHFFATFNRFGPWKNEHRKDLLAEVIRRAADQNESYLELMVINGGSLSPLGTQVGFNGDFAATREKLLAAGIDQYVTRLKTNVDLLEQDRIAGLGCTSKADAPGCAVTVRYVYQVLREFPKEQIFAQIMAGLMLASSDPRVVGINFVQAEDGQTALRDYHLQMQMLDYLKPRYPKAHVTLHAGELAPSLVPPEALRFHIREAMELGHAERIGHGVDVGYESDSPALLRELARRQVLVEINLTSNDLILGVRGQDHPFPLYRRAGVPVALSTDDEGVSRSHLTAEYARAVSGYGLTYADLKQMVRNSLEWAFIDGASLWRDHTYRQTVAECANLSDAKCAAYLDANPKARLQADLENRFAKFEQQTLAPAAR